MVGTSCGGPDVCTVPSKVAAVDTDGGGGPGGKQVPCSVWQLELMGCCVRSRCAAIVRCKWHPALAHGQLNATRTLSGMLPHFTELGTSACPGRSAWLKVELSCAPLGDGSLGICVASCIAGCLWQSSNCADSIMTMAAAMDWLRVIRASKATTLAYNRVSGRQGTALNASFGPQELLQVLVAC
jgi:hypothetical protein